ncbi:MAG: hypothetical protein ABIB61_03670 [Candidatus Shapirobacteria bacterium]
MEIQKSFTDLNPLIAKANKVAILVGGQEYDQLVAGASLALSLEKSGKKVDFFVSQEPGENASGIRGIERARTDFGQKDLQVVFNYPLSKIEKVSSQEEGDKLKLIVKVKPEAESINTNQVQIISQDLNFEVGIVIGEESNFSNFSQFCQKGNWIWLGREAEEKDWAKISIGQNNTSFSEIAARVIQGLGLPFERDIASNLYEGIKSATVSFANLTTYKTLETAALCLKVVQGNGGPKASFASQVPIDKVEKKEGSLPSPKIFRGATTPRI